MASKQRSDIITIRKGAQHVPSITIAIFRTGYNGRHGLSVPEIVYLMEGEGTVFFDDGSSAELYSGGLYILGAGDFLLIVKENIRAIVCRIDQDLVKLSMENSENFECIEDIPDSPNLRYASIESNMLLQHFYAGVFLYLSNGINSEAMFHTKIAELLQIIGQSKKKWEYARFFAPIINKETAFRMFVHRYATSFPTVARLAELTNMSTRTLNGRFREYMGTSPKEFLDHERAKHVKQKLLHHNVPLKNIAYELGISAQYLNRICQKEFNMTPAQIRTKSADWGEKMASFVEKDK